mmetsp:Transcript_20316/g.62813  ORF Transcript_20316/g.62813 Transcript_20316/m.62813 type:complete len:251 (-) Transcript_20316:332-1084(-)
MPRLSQRSPRGLQSGLAVVADAEVDARKEQLKFPPLREEVPEESALLSPEGRPQSEGRGGAERRGRRLARQSGDGGQEAESGVRNLERRRSQRFRHQHASSPVVHGHGRVRDGDGPAFDVVRPEIHARRRELPGEVVRVLDRSVQPEAARRRHLVRRVANEDDATVSVRKAGFHASAHGPGPRRRPELEVRRKRPEQTAKLRSHGGVRRLFERREKRQVRVKRSASQIVRDDDARPVRAEDEVQHRRPRV